MKRKNMIVILILGVLFIMGTMTGCSKENLEQIAGEAAENSRIVSLPDQYSIIYEVENTDGTIVTIEKTRDEYGNIYFRSGETEKLYVRTSDNHYNIYEKDSEGNFKLSSDWKGNTAAFVQNETKSFLEYAEASSKKSSPPINSTGDCEVVGRSCETYEFKTGAGDNAVTYTLQVDKETEVCMAWEKTSTINGIRAGVNEETFRCVDFQVENITMPAYSN